VLSTQLLELFNRTVAPSVGALALHDDAVVGFAFTLVLGESHSSGRLTGGKAVTVQVVGVSERVMMLGITVPRATVERWNRELVQEPPKGFAGAYLVADDTAQISAVVKAAERMGFVVEQSAKTAGAMVTALTYAWLGMALLILVVAGFNVAQTLGARVQARRKELGLMRAVGATQRDIQCLVLGEALLMAMAAASVGVLLGVLAGMAADALVTAYLPRFPFQPNTFFVYPGWLFSSAVVAAVACAFLGALPPALAAARADPVSALEG
jgi:hypothetical protein